MTRDGSRVLELVERLMPRLVAAPIAVWALATSADAQFPTVTVPEGAAWILKCRPRHRGSARIQPRPARGDRHHTFREEGVQCANS
jgi:hypothetical protein